MRKRSIRWFTKNYCLCYLKFGIRRNLLTWFSKFLIGRFFNVNVGNVRSEYTTVNSSLLQGTFIGPLLFILFINNASAGLSNSEIQLYADDSKLYSCADSIEQCQLFESDVSALYHWFTSWKLKINFEKMWDFTSWQ